MDPFTWECITCKRPIPAWYGGANAMMEHRFCAPCWAKIDTLTEQYRQAAKAPTTEHVFPRLVPIEQPATVPCSGGCGRTVVVRVVTANTFAFCESCERRNRSGWYDHSAWGTDEAVRRAALEPPLCEDCSVPVAPGKHLCPDCAWTRWSFAVQDTVQLPAAMLFPAIDSNDPAYAETQPAMPSLDAAAMAIEPFEWTPSDLNNLKNTAVEVVRGERSDYDTLAEQALYSVRGYALHSQVRAKGGPRRYSRLDVAEALDRAFREGGL